jgi:serine/threonine protein kinase
MANIKSFIFEKSNNEIFQCPGGDLFTSIMSERMTEREKACSFKQMMEGLAFIHSMGVAHRDLKPENLLLTMDGKLKITDFGVSDVFRFPWESKGRQSRGLVGSEPYIAPEAFEQKEYWGAAADVWSAGIVFYCIWFGGLVWHKAKKSDGAYAGYVRCCEQNQPFDMFRALPAGGRQVITRMLNVQSDKRITSADVLKDPWVASIPVCENSIDSTNHVHEHTAGFQPVCPVSKK